MGCSHSALEVCTIWKWKSRRRFISESNGWDKFCYHSSFLKQQRDYYDRSRLQNRSLKLNFKNGRRPNSFIQHCCAKKVVKRMKQVGSPHRHAIAEPHNLCWRQKTRNGRTFWKCLISVVGCRRALLILLVAFSPVSPCVSGVKEVREGRRKNGAQSVNKIERKGLKWLTAPKLNAAIPSCWVKGDPIYFLFCLRSGEYPGKRDTVTDNCQNTGLRNVCKQPALRPNRITGIHTIRTTDEHRHICNKHSRETIDPNHKH